MKENKKIFQKTSNSNKGITLVALVITIVILIILATVAINFAFGNNGLINRAEDAKEYYANDTAYTEEALSNVESYIDGIIGENGGGSEGASDPTEQVATAITTITKGEIFSETTKVSDANGDVFYVPGGFGIAEDSPNEIDDGIVITNEGDTKQFVWIPVNDGSLANMYQTESTEAITLPVELSKSTLGENATTTSVYSNLRKRSGDSYSITAPGANTGIREPDILTSTSTGDAVTGTSTKGIEQIKSVLGISGSTNAEVLKNYAQNLVDEYNATYQSIQKYDGFYIGRYEITGSVDAPTVQKDGTVITSQNWYNLKKACTNVVSTEYAQSTMVYGNQWDEVMSWLIATGDKTEPQVNTNSADWGNYNNSTGAAATYSGSKQTAGKNEAWQANNIYDLAGNCWEWTQEAFDPNGRVRRGGNSYGSGSSSPASDRLPVDSSSNGSSRPALYIK